MDRHPSLVRRRSGDVERVELVGFIAFACEMTSILKAFGRVSICREIEDVCSESRSFSSDVLMMSERFSC